MSTKLKESTKMVTGMVRLSYAHLFEPHSMEDDKEKKYSVSLIIPKTDTETIEKIKKAVEVAKSEGASKFGGKIPAKLKLPLRDGDEERPEDDAYKNSYFINANSNNKPQIVDVMLCEITDPEMVYSGCYARVSLNFFAFNSNGNKGIGCGLGNIQKLRDGEKLGGRTTAEEDFADFIGIDDDLEDLPFK